MIEYQSQGSTSTTRTTTRMMVFINISLVILVAVGSSSAFSNSYKHNSKSTLKNHRTTKYFYDGGTNNDVSPLCLKMSQSHSSSSNTDEKQGITAETSEGGNTDKNSLYISSLIDNLSTALDKYIMTGSLSVRTRAYNIIQQIKLKSKSEEQIEQAIRMAKRAGMPLEEPTTPDILNPPSWSTIGTTDNSKLRKEMEESRNSNNHDNDDGGNSNVDFHNRRQEGEERKKWEKERQQQQGTKDMSANIANNLSSSEGRSALSRRSTSNDKPDAFMPSVMNPTKTFVDDKTQLQSEMNDENNDRASEDLDVDDETIETAMMKVSELVASSGSGNAFNGQTLGIGGLDDVLSQIKRRIWVPLAAPPSLLKELGINPVRGLLLYGQPGCGKTLLARSIGKILSPLRPITVVSGPELMDKFVGSSEKNLRAIFDNPPDIYDKYQQIEIDSATGADGGDNELSIGSMSKAALHVIVMDEFDAMARARGGGRGGKGDGQGDAGVARDSVVNQMLAKMDGVDPLVVPTLVIGLTNKRSLIEPALLRPGRFEVQIEVPPPRTIEQRISILRVHTKNMYEAGRVLVSDAPKNTAASRRIEQQKNNGDHGNDNHKLLTYEQLLDLLAIECDGMSGAMLAGIARAAASHALERAVCDFSSTSSPSPSSASSTSIMDCLVTQEDFEMAVDDVLESSGDTDWEGSDENGSESTDEEKGTTSSNKKEKNDSVDEEHNDTIDGSAGNIDANDT